MTLKDYQQIEEAELRITALLYLTESEYLNENLNEGLKDWLKDFGLNLQKSPDVMDYAIRFTSGVGMLIMAALKGDKHQIKAISNNYTRDEFMDFLMKLDNLTLGLVTAPLNIITAVTGWDLLDTLEKTSKNTKKVLGNIKAAIQRIKKDATKILDKQKQQVLNTHLNNIEQTMPI